MNFESEQMSDKPPLFLGFLLLWLAVLEIFKTLLWLDMLM